MTRLTRRTGAGVMLFASVVAAGACGGSDEVEPPVATATVTLNHERAPVGSPLEITYRFVVSPDARVDADYSVMGHVVDADEELMWTDDHQPPVPTSQWQPGQTIEYTRTVFVPIFPYIGDAAFHVGLYRCANPPSCTGPTDRRLPLSAEHVGQHAYRAARLELQPQTENLFSVFKDGWHPAEVAADNATIEWQWTKKDATLAFRNPKTNAVLYLDFDNPAGAYVGSQVVRVTVGAEVMGEITLEPDQRLLRKIRLPADQLGTEDMSELTISVDKTFVPAETPAAKSKDPRELGIRVFHAFVDPR